MHALADQFAKYCDANFDLTTQSEYGYRSLSICILDCIYSLRARVFFYMALRCEHTGHRIYENSCGIGRL